MFTPTVRVLVVDDYEPFRRFLCRTLMERRALKIGGEEADGVEAVCRAEELRPDQALLDIGLPSLNGIEAAGKFDNLPPNLKFSS